MMMRDSSSSSSESGISTKKDSMTYDQFLAFGQVSEVKQLGMTNPGYDNVMYKNAP